MHTKFILLFIIFLLVLSACAPTPTAIPTLTPEPTATNTPVPTITPTPTATPVPLPVFSELDAFGNPYSPELLSRIQSGEAFLLDQQNQLAARVAGSSEMQVVLFEDTSNGASADNPILAALAPVASDTPATGMVYVLPFAPADPGVLELYTSISVKTQVELNLSTDLAGTHLGYRQGIGGTGIVLLDQYNRIIGCIDEETGAWTSYAEEFNPSEVSTPGGENLYINNPAQMPEGYAEAFKLAPEVFNGGRLVYSKPLARLAYIDSKGNVEGLVNFKNDKAESYIADEEGFWYGNETGLAAIKAYGWENAVFVVGDHPEYNQVLFMLDNLHVDPNGPEHFVNYLRSLFAVAYYLNNNMLIPNEYNDTFDYFTRGDGRLLFRPDERNGIYTWTGEQGYDFGHGEISLHQPFIFMMAKEVVRTYNYTTDPIIVNNPDEFIYIERSVNYINRDEEEWITSFLDFLPGHLSTLLYGDRTDTNCENYNRYLYNFSRKTFLLDPNKARLCPLILASRSITQGIEPGLQNRERQFCDIAL